MIRTRAYAFLSLLLACVHAQSASSLISELPSCALTCVLKYSPATGCGLTDFDCLCAVPQLWTNTTACVIPSCTVKEALTAENISNQLCQRPVRDRTLEIRLIGPTLSAVAIFFVIIRVAARRPFSTNLFSWDDGLIVFAALLCIPVIVIDIYLANLGFGKDIWTLPFDHITQILRFLFVVEFLYVFTNAVTRISILVFYLRIFTSSRTLQTTAYILIAINAAFWFATFWPLLWQCTPVSYTWTRWSGETHGTCIDLNAGVWANAAINMALDLAVLVLPLPLLSQLHLSYPWWKKLRVVIMFSFGVVVTIVSILRLRTLISFATTRNPTWDLVPATVWSVIESKVGIICACLPMAKVFFTRLAPQWLGLTVAATAGSERTPTEQYQYGKGNWSDTSASDAYSTRRLSKPAQRTMVAVRDLDDDRCQRGVFLELSDLESVESHDIGIAK